MTKLAADVRPSFLHSRKMTKIRRSLPLIGWLCVGMMEILPVARSAEPPKNPPGAEVLPLEISKGLAQPAGLARMDSLRVAAQSWATTDPQSALSMLCLAIFNMQEFSYVD